MRTLARVLRYPAPPWPRIRLILTLALCLGAAPATTYACGDGTGPCCKVCKNSKPCGDSCIPVNYTCTKGAGCACAG